MREQVLMRAIQAALSAEGVKCFRANVGTGWTGDQARRNPDGSITIFNPRVFSTGLPKGFPDLMAFCPGGNVALLEVKTATGRQSEAQVHFAEVMGTIEHMVAVVRSEEEALAVCRSMMDLSK